MKALVVVESMYGNTAKVAEAIGRQMDAPVIAADELTDGRLEGVDLLVVGAPTHAFGLPKASTRRQAMEAVKRPAAGTEVGLRERLEALHPHPGMRAAAFSTRMDVRFLPKRSADRVIAKMLKHLGFDVVAKEAFVVDGSEGPLHEGELERAMDWAAPVAAKAA
jgi:hypothetical protein